MDVTPQELRGSEIKEAWRGYHRDEVDELLERAAVTIENLSQQLSTAGARPAAPSADPGPLQLSRDDADTLQRTLLLAQRAADDAVNDAQAQARKLIEESEARAQSLVGEAEATARRIAESERRRLEAEIQDLAARRDVLQADADALEDYASAYRDRVPRRDRGRPRPSRERHHRSAASASRALRGRRARAAHPARTGARDRRRP